MKKLQKGLVPVLALIIIAILAVLLSAGAYYILKGIGKYPAETGERAVDYTQEESLSPEEVPVSDSDKTSDIEAELESTNIGEVKSDIELLDADAGSL